MTDPRGMPAMGGTPSAGERAPSVSVVVPGCNSAATLEACLSALRVQDWPADRYEVVYADDGSTDASAEIAGRWADRVLQLGGPSRGPAAARNAGAARARGGVLVFIDADVVAPPGTVRALVRPLVEGPGLDAVFGSYDAEPAHPSTLSQYRNLLHHHVHQTSRAEAETFWAGCGAVRRASFERAGGFDAVRYRRPSIEDIELGRRMRAAGMRIRLAREVQVKHLKRWTLREVVRSDIFARGIPWMRLLLGEGARSEVGDLNLRVSAALSAPLAWGAVVLLPAALRRPALLGPAALLAGAVVAMNAPTYAFFRRARGPRFALAALPLHFLYHLCNGVSVVGGLLLSALLDEPLAGWGAVGRLVRAPLAGRRFALARQDRAACGSRPAPAGPAGRGEAPRG